MISLGSTPKSTYEAEIQNYRMISSRACGVVVVVLIMMGILLDYALYPERMAQFALARSFASLCILAALALLYTELGEKHVQLITFLWLLAPQVMIAWMISVTNGQSSLFYAGLILSVFAIGSLFPVGYWHTIAYGILTIALYTLACFTHANGITIAGEYMFHTVIIAFAVIGSAVFTYFNERNRQQMFDLKDELAKNNMVLVQTNADLIQIKGEMLQQEKMAAIGTLAAGLLHEVNNPINFSMMAVDIAMEDPNVIANAFIMDCLNDARQGMQRIQFIISDLKTFAYRSDNVTQTKSFLFENALSSAVRLTGHELKGITVDKRLVPATFVVGDEAAIVGVLINLLSNAAIELKRSKINNPRIFVSAEWMGDRLQVSVEDNGAGIPESSLTRVFEPFFTTREAGQGLGLGLSISYRVVEQHGGILRAESKLENGTKMLFDLTRSN